MLILLVIVALFVASLYAWAVATQEGRKLQRARVRAEYGNAGAWYGRTNKVW